MNKKQKKRKEERELVLNGITSNLKSHGYSEEDITVFMLGVKKYAQLERVEGVYAAKAMIEKGLLVEGW
jgi:hypothetical protein